MTATYVGSYTIGGAVPAAAASSSLARVGLEAAAPDISGQLAALAAAASALASLPPPVFPEIAAHAAATLGALQLAIATPGLPAPPAFNAAAIAALMTAIADLTARLTGINAALTATVNLQTLLAAAGVHVVAFQSAAGSVGGEIQAAIATPVPSGTARGVALVTTSTATYNAMTQVFRVTP